MYKYPLFIRELIFTYLYLSKRLSLYAVLLIQLSHLMNMLLILDVDFFLILYRISIEMGGGGGEYGMLSRIFLKSSKSGQVGVFLILNAVKLNEQEIRQKYGV